MSAIHRPRDPRSDEGLLAAIGMAAAELNGIVDELTRYNALEREDAALLRCEIRTIKNALRPLCVRLVTP